ncbi:MAG TPA: glycosyltransferase family 4 protein [Thermohalobaculum sp.]|nr:glycosyltransferase family 4 protein [Thermohalobaculum sp.]
MTLRLPRRVLMTADAVGGVWQFSLDLARGLSAAGTGVRLAVLGPPPTPERVAEAAAVPGLTLDVTELPLDWTAENEAEIAEAAAALAARAGKADLVHLNHPVFAEARWSAPVLSVVHSCHGSWWDAMRGDAIMPPGFRWRAARMRRALAASARVVAPTAALADVLERLYQPPRRIAVIRNGRQPAPRAAEAEAEAGAGPFVLTAGRLWDEAKNIATLDAAAAEIDVPVVAAGPVEGPNGERAEAKTLVLAGELSAVQMAARLRAARVFVSAARYEPFGLAVLEAAQAARPLVLSDIPTFRELWEGAALFVPWDDPAAFARQVRRLLDDPAEAERWGAHAARRAARYSVASMIEGYGRAYSTLMARQPNGAAG